MSIAVGSRPNDVQNKWMMARCFREILLADWLENWRRRTTKQTVGLRQFRGDHQIISDLLRPNFNDIPSAIERALTL